MQSKSKGCYDLEIRWNRNKVGKDEKMEGSETQGRLATVAVRDGFQARVSRLCIHR